MTAPDPRHTPSCDDCGYSAAVLIDGRCRTCADDYAELLAVDVADPARDAWCDAVAAADVGRRMHVDRLASQLLPAATPVAARYAAVVLAAPASFRDRPSRVLAVARSNSVAPGLACAAQPQAPTVRPGWRAVLSLRAEVG